MKIKFGFIFIITILISSCSSNSCDSTQEIGEYSFSILQDMEDMSKMEYSKMLVTYEDFIEMAKDDDFIPQKELREYFLNMPKREFIQNSFGNYRDLKRYGEEYNIKWEDIKKTSFRSKKRTKSKKGIAYYTGELEIKSGKKYYYLQTRTVFNGNDYLLQSMRFREPIYQGHKTRQKVKFSEYSSREERMLQKEFEYMQF